MKLTCPSCESSYQLADGALGATGRKVRCTRCGTVWHARPGADMDAEDDDPVARAAARFPEPTEDDWKAALAEDAPVGRAAEPGADDDWAAAAAETVESAGDAAADD
ncbi:zinc-ribbon domain-containing protein, partial [Oharaeibacter diazotrophicus]